MQVVFSGGSTCAPYASPRFCRKVYGQPFMPGYSKGGNTAVQAPHVQLPHKPPHHNPRQLRHHAHHNQHHVPDEESLRDSIPAMRRGVAITCLVLNIIVPGLGTLVSGFTVCCGSRVRKKAQSVSSVIRTNCLVAVIQFATTFLFLLGWIWSVMWGVAFISHSAEYDADSTERAHGSPIAATEHAKQVHHKPRAEPALSDECIITLQEPPVSEEQPGVETRSKPILSCVNPRQQRILRRRMSDQEFQTAMLTTDGIEEIIVRDYPVHNFNGDVVSEPIPEDSSSPSKW